jgi:hypothetical protein
MLKSRYSLFKCIKQYHRGVGNGPASSVVVMQYRSGVKDLAPVFVLLANDCRKCDLLCIIVLVLLLLLLLLCVTLYVILSTLVSQVFAVLPMDCLLQVCSSDVAFGNFLPSALNG